MTDATPVCTSCRQPLTDARFDLCPSCNREIRGPFEFERADDNQGESE